MRITNPNELKKHVQLPFDESASLPDRILRELNSKHKHEEAIQ